MECWKEKCENKPEFVCPCTTPPIYSCDLHIVTHLKINSKSGHHPESLTILPNPTTKRVLIDHLHQSLANLFKFRRETIADISKQIKNLNEKLKIKLNSFKEAIQNHHEMIFQISSLEVISKLGSNKINDILLLEPEESIKMLNKTFNIYDESKLFIDDEEKIIKSRLGNETKQHVVFRDKTMTIVKTELNKFSSAEFNMQLDNLKSMYISMCLVPENSIFCYGNYPNSANTAFIIEPNNDIKQVKNAPFALGLSFSNYYKGRVFIFGGYNGNTYVNTSFNYDLKSKNWENLSPLPVPSCFVSCICKKNKILLCGREHTKIYCYDIIQKSYAELHNVQVNFKKIICGNKLNYYVIEAHGNIYESNHEWEVWRIVGSSGIGNINLIGFVVLSKNKAYFTLQNYKLYEFDFKVKKCQEIKTI